MLISSVIYSTHKSIISCIRYYCFFRDKNIQAQLDQIIFPKPYSYYVVESGIKPRCVWKLQWSGKSTGVGVKNAFIHIAATTFVHRGWFARLVALHRAR